MTDVLAVASDSVASHDTSYQAVENSPFDHADTDATLSFEEAEGIIAVWDGEEEAVKEAIEYALREGIELHVEPVDYDGVFNNSLTEQELLRRLPELKQVGDLQIRGQAVEAILSGHPDYIWEVPSSGSGMYHPPDERGKHGQWLHVKRAFYAYDEMSESLVQAGVISKREREAGRVAVLLHDMFKNGIPPTPNSAAVNTHDLLAANYVRFCTDLPDVVADLCETHNGPWGEGRLPNSVHEWVFHEADMIASRNASNLGVHEPTEELLGISDEIIDAGNR